MINHYDWTKSFKSLYEQAVKRYSDGQRGADTFFDAEGQAFLDSIGATAQEIYDFAEDACNYGDPDYSTALLITAARRDYFMTVQHGIKSEHRSAADKLSAKTDKLEGIEWLPRIIEKAQLKLKGEMAPEIMYGCGGDRRFLQAHGIHPADFLRVVWSAREDVAVVLNYVKNKSQQKT
jgi:hypothetical protein